MLAFVDPESIFKTVGTHARQSPYMTAFVIGAVKGSAADLVAQSSARHGNKAPYDYRRMSAFLLYGGLYQGMTLELLYNNLFNKMFGENVLQKLAFNQLVLTPAVTLPAAYAMKGLVFGNIPEALKEYWMDVTQNGLILTFWKLWTPFNFLLFSVIPPHLRIATNAIVSFTWTIILSNIANAKHDEKKSHDLYIEPTKAAGITTTTAGIKATTAGANGPLCAD